MLVLTKLRYSPSDEKTCKYQWNPFMQILALPEILWPFNSPDVTGPVFAAKFVTLQTNDYNCNHIAHLVSKAGFSVFLQLECHSLSTVKIYSAVQKSVFAVLHAIFRILGIIVPYSSTRENDVYTTRPGMTPSVSYGRWRFHDSGKLLIVFHKVLGTVTERK